MIDHRREIEEDLKIHVGLGATYHIGLDSYPYYVSEVLPNGVIGIYSPDSHFKKDWTDGDKIVDEFDPEQPTKIYIKRSYGHWWKCTKDGKRIDRFHSICFGHAISYRDPCF